MYKPLQAVNATSEDALSDADDISSVGSADQDLKAKYNKPGVARRTGRRTRGASTVDRMNLGYPKAGNRFRLASHSDMQSAVMWMEGKPGPAKKESPPDKNKPPPLPAQVVIEDPQWQDPELKGDSRGRLLPMGLVGSLLFGVMCTALVQRQVVDEVFGSTTALVFIGVAACVFLVTFLFLTLAALSDPGQVPSNADRVPQRSHKNFLYPRHLLRYDHYCRWIMNCIALKNHREFFVMLVGLVCISIGGFCVDIPLLCICVSRNEWFFALALSLHFGYSAGFCYYVLPIFRLHVRFVSRNELANEWKSDLFYVLEDEDTGDYTWVGDLDPMVFNERYDDFQYDPTRNPWDKGCPMNCCLFWCTSRSSEREYGEF